MQDEIRDELIETVGEHCQHPDCAYRGMLSGYRDMPYCNYITVIGKSRGCKISECDKYKAGVKTQPRMKPEFWIEWEYDYDADDNTVW